MATRKGEEIPNSDCFPSTQWTVVLAAGDVDDEKRQEALENLCRVYWRPLYYFARRKVAQPADAQDLVQGFFERLIEKDFLARPIWDETKSFRGFLKCALERFRINEWKARTAKKRGGGAAVLRLDFDGAESDFLVAEVDGISEEETFDRSWALTTFGRALEEVKEHYESNDKRTLFEFLKSTLPGHSQQRRKYALVAEDLGISENTLKSEVKRFRENHFPRALRNVVSNTMHSPSSNDLDGEIRYLLGIVVG